MSEGNGAEDKTTPQVERPGAQAKAFNNAVATAGIAAVVFIIGVVVGFPLATFGVEFLTGNAGVVFGLLFAFLVLVLVVTGLLMIFRKTIWERLFRRGEIEMERFARPLSEVARFAALQKVAEATESARDLAELVLARYAWVSTRRWLMATITAFIAAIAALAGSALLFQQNQLLRTQIGLMEDQNARIAEQNRFIEAQIELGEAQRSTSIVPEVLEVGTLVGAEVQALRARGVAAPAIADLSSALKSRILAALTAARPYRYLQTPLAGLDEQAVMNSGLLRRTDLPAAAILRDRLAVTGVTLDLTGEQRGVMADRPLSPERGQIIAILLGNGLVDITNLGGGDFGFAEVRGQRPYKVSFGFSNLRFADFDGEFIAECSFDGTYLEHARFRNTRIDATRFSTTSLPSISGGAPLVKGAELSGTDFSGAQLVNVTFEGSRGFGMFFDNAVLNRVSFKNSDLSGGTFRGTIFGAVDFTGASLKSVDFDGALVFDPEFLTTVAAQAAPDTFDPARFRLEPITPAEFETHPRWAVAWLDGLEEKQAYKVVRIGDFN